MRILEKLVKKIPNRVIRLLKKPLMIGTHHLMFSISPVRTRLQPRKFQLSISTRTGTASIAGLFQARYRARHEPEDIYTSEKIIDYIKGYINERQMISFIKKRDKCLWLEVESSHFLYFFIDILLKKFDFLSKIDKKFLKKKFDLYCKDLMKIYYPELIKIDYGIRKD